MLISQLLLSILTICGQVQAQVATVNLNPAIPASAPGAIAWEYLPLEVAVGFDSKSGDKTFGDTTVGETLTTKETKSSGPQVCASSNLEKISFQGHYSSSEFEEQSVNFNTESTTLALSAAYIYKKVLSLGLGFRKDEVENEQTNLASWMDGTEIGFNSETNQYQLGASWHFAKNFYLGTGLHFVMQDHNKRVDNSWFDRWLGLAILPDANKDQRWRTEFSVLHSPERKKKAEGSLWINHHRQALALRLEGELRRENWMVSAVAYQRTDKAPTSNTSDIKTTLYQLAIGASLHSWEGPLGVIILGKEKIRDDYFTTDMTTLLLTGSWSL